MVSEAIVAAIEDDALLGYDILVNGGNGPADILLSKGKIVLDNIEIPCVQVGSGRGTRKVVIADDASIPGNSEALIDVFIREQKKMIWIMNQISWWNQHTTLKRVTTF